MISYYVQCISIVKRKANSTIEQQNCNGHGKRDRLLISKMEIDYLQKLSSMPKIVFKTNCLIFPAPKIWLSISARKMKKRNGCCAFLLNSFAFSNEKVK